MNKTTVAALALFVAGTALAQQGPKPEDLIAFRQAGYKFMAWNTGRIKANLEGSYNKEEVIKAANVIAAVAGSGMGALFAPGTEKAVGNMHTHAKPALFTDKEGVGKVAMAFNKEAGELAKVAATGDAAAVKVQFGKLVEACKACHKDYRVEEKHEH
ncbi:MAG: cytochrome c [Rhodocyclaceae bacterium]|nr:cytochrome c [Rhodocyclaceae bacterium]